MEKKHVMWIFFPKSSKKKKKKKAYLESGQSFLVLFYHSDGRGEPFLVINRGVWGFFKLQLQTKDNKFNFH